LWCRNKYVHHTIWVANFIFLIFWETFRFFTTFIILCIHFTWNRFKMPFLDRTFMHKILTCPSCWNWGVRGRVVKVVDFKPLAPHRCGFEFRQGLWIISCEEAIQLAYGTSVVLLRCSFVPQIMHGGAPEVFLHQ
jgi:hypothetical protein